MALDLGVFALNNELGKSSAAKNVFRKRATRLKPRIGAHKKTVTGINLGLFRRFA